MFVVTKAKFTNHPLKDAAPDYPLIVREVRDVGEVFGNEEVLSAKEIQQLRTQYKDVIEQYRREQQALSRRRITLEAEAEVEEVDGEDVIIKAARLNHSLETDGSFRSIDPDGGFVAYDPDQGREVMIKVVDGVLTIIPASGSPRYSKQKLAKLREAKREKLAALKAEKVEDLVGRAESATRVADVVKVVKSLAKRLAALEAAMTIQEE